MTEKQHSLHYKVQPLGKFNGMILGIVRLFCTRVTNTVTKIQMQATKNKTSPANYSALSTKLTKKTTNSRFSSSSFCFLSSSSFLFFSSSASRCRSSSSLRFRSLSISSCTHSNPAFNGYNKNLLATVPVALSRDDILAQNFNKRPLLWQQLSTAYWKTACSATQFSFIFVCLNYVGITEDSQIRKNITASK